MTALARRSAAFPIMIERQKRAVSRLGHFGRDADFRCRCEVLSSISKGGHSALKRLKINSKVRVEPFPFILQMFKTN